MGLERAEAVEDSDDSESEDEDEELDEEDKLLFEGGSDDEEELSKTETGVETLSHLEIKKMDVDDLGLPDK